jgi:uncharacterized protein (UPF0261 family)
MITDGTAPAIDYGIKPREDGRFEMAELAAAGKWNAVAGYVCNGLNSYAKMVRQYRDRLVAAHNAQDASMTRRPGNGERALARASRCRRAARRSGSGRTRRSS